jgi:hypothetical protein
MHVGRVRRTYEAHLELVAWRRNQTPTSIILGFFKLIEALLRSDNTYFWSAVSSEAVRTAAEAGAQIAITVYGPMKVMKQSRKSSKAASSK